MRPLLFASLLLVSGIAAQDSPTIRVDVSLVRVVATVKNRSGQLVGTLGKPDFEILDNGAPQEVSVFSHETEQPLSVALLIDTSGSTAKDLHAETEAAGRFLHALLSEGNPEDSVSLYTFEYDVRERRRFTRNFAALERDLKLIKPEGGASSVYDAVFFAAHALEERQGRKVIVIVTDGGDTSSTRTLKEALKAAQLADAVVYAVVMMPITNDAGRNIGGENALTFMAEGTGGRTFPQVNGLKLDRTFSDIIAELRTQYFLGFYPRNVPLTKNPFHTLEVRVKTPGLQVSARNGYYGDAEGSAGSPDARISITPERERKKNPAPPEKKKK